MSSWSSALASAAWLLRALRRAPVRITILDRSNHHLFQPLLYQVAAARSVRRTSPQPIRRIFRHQANVTVMLADATAINVTEKRVVLLDGSVDYDILILATARPMHISATTIGLHARPVSRA